MSGPANAVVGDQNFGTDLPITTPAEGELLEEKHMAKYSKTKEYKRLEEYLEARISFFQNHFPDGTPLAAEKEYAKIVDYWRVANIVIAEFKAVLTSYENARGAVEANESRRNSQL